MITVTLKKSSIRIFFSNVFVFSKMSLEDHLALNNEKIVISIIIDLRSVIMLSITSAPS